MTTESVNAQVNKLQKHARKNDLKQNAFAESVGSRLEKLQATVDHTGATVDATATSVEVIKNTLVGISSIGQRLLYFINTFPVEMRELLHRVVRSNLQIYTALQQHQAAMPPTPTNLLQSNIRFENGLGVIQELPYEFFRHWEICKKPFPDRLELCKLTQEAIRRPVEGPIPKRTR